MKFTKLSSIHCFDYIEIKSSESALITDAIIMENDH